MSTKTSGMATVRTLKRSFIAVGVALSACGGAPSAENPEYAAAAARADAGLVAPLKDDTSDEIVSWVDGQVVTDWTAEIAKRDRAIDGYLNDTDPARAEKYGFRSGQNPQLAWSWFRDNPVGFNGVPFVLFKTILDLDPNHANPTLRAIARIWKREAIVPVRRGHRRRGGRSITSASDRTRSDYVDGVARPASERQSPLPFGFAFENPRTFEPLSAAETTVYDGRLLARRVFQNTSLLIAKLRTADKEENWERDRPGFGSPGSMDRVFLSCARLPRRPRDGVGEDEVPARDAEHRDRGAVLLEAADAHRRGAGRVRLRPEIDHAGESGQHQAEHQRRPRAVRGDARQGAPAAGNAVRSVAGADRPREDSGAGRRRRIPERHAGSDRRRREDAFHLPRRREEQRLQAAAARCPRGSSGTDGRVRHRVGPGGDPHAAAGQQLSRVRPSRQSEEPVLTRDSRRRTACPPTCRA